MFYYAKHPSIYIQLDKDPNSCVAVLPKSASTSMRESLNGLPTLCREEVESKCSRIIIFVNTWEDRLKKCYCFFKHKAESRRLYLVPNEVLVDIESFIDWMMENPDSHWQPQYYQCCLEDRFLPNEIYKFEDMGNTWSEITDRVLLHLNPAPEYPIPDLTTLGVRYEKLLEYYQKDIELRASF